MPFEIDFTGHCRGCELSDVPGTLATVGTQLHLLVFVGLWVYSFIHREVFVWAMNLTASLLLAVCHAVHKVDVLGSQPPCLSCVVALYDRVYNLEGSAVPCAPVALLCFYMTVLFACPLELGSACTYNEAEKQQMSAAQAELEWKRLQHLDVLIIPVWSAVARLYVGLTTPEGVASGAVLGGLSAVMALELVRTGAFRAVVEASFSRRYWFLLPVQKVLQWLHFENRFLKILWHNDDDDGGGDGGAGAEAGGRGHDNNSSSGTGNSSARRRRVLLSI